MKCCPCCEREGAGGKVGCEEGAAERNPGEATDAVEGVCDRKDVEVNTGVCTLLKLSSGIE